MSLTKSQRFLLQLLRLTRDCHVHNMNNRKPNGWFYQGPADLLLREGKWYSRKGGKVVRWEHSEPQGCFRNAALYAMDFKGYRYVEGYATSIVPVHHGWCVDADNHILELTWDELGTNYYGVEFDPMLVLKGSVLFNHPNARIYKRELKPRPKGKGTKCTAR